MTCLVTIPKGIKIILTRPAPDHAIQCVDVTAIEYPVTVDVAGAGKIPFVRPDIHRCSVSIGDYLRFQLLSRFPEDVIDFFIECKVHFRV